MTATTARRTAEAIERLAAAPLSREQFQWQTAEQLHRVVGFDYMSWSLVDPGTLLPSWTVADNPVTRNRQRRLYQLWPAPSELHELASTGYSIASRGSAGAERRDARRREILEPGELGDFMTVALVADGLRWGMIHLFRDRAGRPFGADDASAITRLGPLLADRLRRSVVEPVATPCSQSGAGTIVLDEQLALLATTPAAEEWLARLPRPAPGGDPLPGCLYALAARATCADLHRDGLSGSPRSWKLRIRATDGTWLVLRAEPLSTSLVLGTGAVAVTVEPAHPVELRPLLMRAHRLSDRESQVAAMVMAGLDNPGVARELHITRHTVSDHLKSIHSKLGVTSRAGLTAHLSGQSLPRVPLDDPPDAVRDARPHR